MDCCGRMSTIYLLNEKKKLKNNIYGVIAFLQQTYF